MNYVSVTDIVKRIKDSVSKDYRLQNVAVAGSIVNLKKHSSGHCYMLLKDEGASLSSILFANRAAAYRTQLEEGQLVVAIGTVQVYEKTGQVSFIIDKLFLQGIGSWQLQYDKLKKELTEQGYFSTDHKQPLPRFCWTIGLITSATGAVLHDMLKIASERNPFIKTILYPVTVQGDGAADTIVKALIKANGDAAHLDVIIIARGGGSIEDLWCFNDAKVVRAIYASKVPVVTAIGHETDTTLADYAADVRAATPTHAAEMTFFPWRELQEELWLMQGQLHDWFFTILGERQRQLQKIGLTKSGLLLQKKIAARRALITQQMRLGSQNFEMRMMQKSMRYEALRHKLVALNPLGLAHRGFGRLEQSGKPLKQARDAQLTAPLWVYLTDGKIRTTVNEVIIYDENKSKSKP